MVNLLKEVTGIFIQLVEMQGRLVLLESSANQQSILLDAVLAMLEKSMGVKSSTSPNTCGIEFDPEERNV